MNYSIKDFFNQVQELQNNSNILSNMLYDINSNNTISFL